MKNTHEIFVCQDFLRYYNDCLHTDYSIIRHGEQGRINEPDCICSNGLYIEVVGVYYDNAHAKSEWELARENITLPEFNAGQPVQVNPDQKVFNFMEIELAKKEKKLAEGKYKYSGKIVLLIDAVKTAITCSADYEEYFSGKKPLKSGFDEIWLRAFVNCGTQNKFLKIFP